MTKSYATVKFPSSFNQKHYPIVHYTYFYDSEKLDLKEYDAVIVETQYGPSLAIVSEVYDEDTVVCAKCEVLEIVESKVVEEIVKKDKKNELEKKMQARAKKLSSVKQYEVFAEMDEEFAEMFAKFKELI